MTETKAGSQFIEFSRAFESEDFKQCSYHSTIFGEKCIIPCLFPTNSQIKFTNIERKSVKILRIIMDTWECSDVNCVYIRYCQDHKVW